MLKAVCVWGGGASRSPLEDKRAWAIGVKGQMYSMGTQHRLRIHGLGEFRAGNQQLRTPFAPYFK